MCAAAGLHEQPAGLQGANTADTSRRALAQCYQQLQHSSGTDAAVGLMSCARVCMRLPVLLCQPLHTHRARCWRCWKPQGLLVCARSSAQQHQVAVPACPHPQVITAAAQTAQRLLGHHMQSLSRGLVSAAAWVVLGSRRRRQRQATAAALHVQQQQQQQSCRLKSMLLPMTGSLG